MAYDEGLAQRVEDALGGMDGLEAKKMFGGVGYLLNGNMAVGVLGDGLIVRTGWVTVGPEGVSEDADLEEWVEIGVVFAAGLPPK
jgi:hypothetical protein